MGNAEYKLRYACSVLTCVTITIVSFSVVTVEYHRIFAYVPTYCLVKSSLLSKCNTPVRADETGLNRCFVPVWLIEHKVSGKAEKATIVGSQLLLQYEDRDKNHTQIFKPYEIGGIYRCYHSDRLKKVQWNRPNYIRLTAAVICEIVSISFCIRLLWDFLRHRCRRNNVHRNGGNEAVPTAQRIIRERTPLNPSPHVVPQTIPTEEDALVTPPPPYTPSIRHSEEVQDNIPVTPPPPYV